jgi:hypothetical protein
MSSVPTYADSAFRNAYQASKKVPTLFLKMYEARGPRFFQWRKPIRSCKGFSAEVALVANIQNSTSPKTENEDKVRGQIRSRKGKSRRGLLTFDAEQIDHQDDQDDDGDDDGRI